MLHLGMILYTVLSYTYDVIQRRRQVYKYDSLTCGLTTGLITGYQTANGRKCTASIRQIVYRPAYRALS